MNDRYYDLNTLSGECCLCVRTLREHLKDKQHPLPYFKVGGKVLVKWSEFETWMEKHRARRRQGKDDLDKTVDDLAGV
jgi:hypothetical protein